MRSARSRTWAVDSSPVTISARPPPRGEAVRDLEQQRGLADPGLAGEQDHRAGHEAAAEHPVEFGRRRSGRARASSGESSPMGRAERVTGPGATADARGAAPTSMTVPQAWHSGQRPTQRSASAPHSVQR